MKGALPIICFVFWLLTVCWYLLQVDQYPQIVFMFMLLCFNAFLFFSKISLKESVKFPLLFLLGIVLSQLQLDYLRLDLFSHLFFVHFIVVAAWYTTRNWKNSEQKTLRSFFVDQRSLLIEIYPRTVKAVEYLSILCVLLVNLNLLYNLLVPYESVAPYIYEHFFLSWHIPLSGAFLLGYLVFKRNPRMRALTIFIITLVTFSLFYQKINNVQRTPLIFSITPAEVVRPWKDVIIVGQDFGVSQYNDAAVYIDGVEQRLAEWERERIVMIADPNYVKTGMLEVVNVDGKKSNAVRFIYDSPIK